MSQRIGVVDGLLISGFMLMNTSLEQFSMTAQLEQLGSPGPAEVHQLMAANPCELLMLDPSRQASEIEARQGETAVQAIAAEELTAEREKAEQIRLLDELGEAAKDVLEASNEFLEKKGEQEQAVEEIPYIEAAAEALAGRPVDLSQEAQDALRQAGEDQANLAVKHQQERDDQEKQLSDIRSQFTEQHQHDRPETMQENQLRLDAAEKAARDTLAARQEAERQELASRAQTPPARSM